MANALLLNTVDVPSTSSCLMPDNGLAALAASLLDAGHHVQIWDPGTLDVLHDVAQPRLRHAATTIPLGRLSPPLVPSRLLSLSWVGNPQAFRWGWVFGREACTTWIDRNGALKHTHRKPVGLGPTPSGVPDDVEFP